MVNTGRLTSVEAVSYVVKVEVVKVTKIRSSTSNAVDTVRDTDQQVNIVCRVGSLEAIENVLTNVKNLLPKEND